MPKLSKFFRVAVEGATCDGRTLDRADLQEMADTYDPTTYTARVNMEHIRGFSADPPFNAYGDVKALKTEDVELKIGGKTVKKLGLFAQVEALDTLIALQAKGQKLFSSIELNPAFADSGKAYLQGLAITDSPASLGTEIMTFAASQGDKNPFAARKVAPGNFFSAAEETAIEFEADASAPSGAAAMFAAATDFFKNFGKSQEPAKEEKKDPPPHANDNDAVAQLAAQIGEGFQKLSAAVAAQGSELTGKLTKLQGEHDALKASIDTTDNDAGNRRPPATGPRAKFAQTDC
jgi:hypothetical protein